MLKLILTHLFHKSPELVTLFGVKVLAEASLPDEALLLKLCG